MIATHGKWRKIVSIIQDNPCFCIVGGRKALQRRFIYTTQYCFQAANLCDNGSLNIFHPNRNMTTHWIAITGGIGSGKSTVTQLFREWNIPCLDADAINRHITQTPQHPALQKIAHAFGTNALNDSGCLNRDFIRQLVFSQPAAKQQLERILLPEIFAEIQHQQTQYTALYGLIELPTLHAQSNFRQLVERILLVTADENTRIKRVMARSHLNEKQIHAIIASQISDEQRLAFANDHIHNSGSLNDLRQAVTQQHHFYQTLFN